MSDSTARDAILGRIRQALRTSSPEPHWMHEPVSSGPLFPLPDQSESSLKARFREEFVSIQGEWFESESIENGRQQLVEWLRRNEFIRIAAPKNAGLQRFWNDVAAIEWKEAQADTKGWEAIDLGVTTAESLVAESGTIVVSAGISGRALSVLPPHHLVIATADQITPDLEGSFARLRAQYGDQLPSTTSWISGPSRTADIEKILVLGAHGPRRLTLLLLPTGSLA